jgi:GntR family transcriptional regulator, transcriptional repressor for pyruvate dehydrogenase complex
VAISEFSRISLSLRRTKKIALIIPPDNRLSVLTEYYLSSKLNLLNLMSSLSLDRLNPVSRTTLSEQVATRLAARINAGDWRPGTKLPSEAELCKVFGVGRSSLREALTSLAFIGLIRVRAGGGSYVSEQPSAYFTSPWLNSGLLGSAKLLNEFVEVRLILGTEVAGLCAARITPEELDEIERLVEQMKASIHDSEEFSKLDVSFHLAMASAAKNEVLSQILSSVREQTMELITKSVLLEEGRESALRGHIKILEAVRQRNPTKARKALRNHLQSFQRGYKVLFEQNRLNEQG